jgi:hypothetical protein
MGNGYGKEGDGRATAGIMVMGMGNMEGNKSNGDDDKEGNGNRQ